MTASTSAVLFAVVLLAACSGGPPEAKTFATDSLPHPTAAPKLPDSLALRAPDGTEIWFTDARSAKAESGEPCIERVMQLRRDTTRVAIPLLYTAEAPRMVNDTLAETHIFLNCKPGNLYRINLRNGQPIYVRAEVRRMRGASLLVLAALTACGGGPPPVQPAPEAAAAPAELRSLEAAIVAQVRRAVGAPYRLGGRDSTGFDCSGLIQSAYAAQGFVLPRISRDQARAGRAVAMDVARLRPGDILAFASDGRAVSHVGLYVGEGRFIHSASRGVRESRLDPADPDGRWYVQRWVGARRVLPTWPGAPADSTD